MKLPPKKKGISEQFLKLIAYNPLAGLHKPPKFKKRKSGGRAKFADGGAPDDTDEPVVVNKPFGELTASPRPTPTQWLSNKTQDLMEYAGAAPHVARHLTEGLGGIANLTPLGIAGAAADAVDAKARGNTGGAAMAMAGMLPGAGPIERKVAEEVAPAIRAYHGSPHDFDRFDLSKIGTGEGNQGFGHGMYFAENEKTALDYRTSLMGGGADMSNPEHVAALYSQGMGDRQSAISALRDNAKNASEGDPVSQETLHKAADLLESGATPSKPGRSYEVNINADPAHFLDWDKPFSEQHPSVQQALKDHGIEPPATGGVLSRESSQKLASSGVPGVKYLDGGSRAAGDGTRNYVVFDDNLIDIVKKYALAGIALPPAIAAQYEQIKQAGSLPPSFASGGAVQRMADGGVPAFDEARGPDPVGGPPPFDEARGPDKDSGSVNALASGAAQGATFGFSDELRGLQEAGGAGPRDPASLSGLVKGAYKYWTGDKDAEKRYTDAVTREREADEQAKAQHPYLHMAGELAGSIPAMAVLPGGNLAEGANLATKMVKGAQFGAEYGGLSGVGEGKDLADSALKSATGIVGGIVGGAAAPVVGAGLSKIADRVVSPAVGAVRAAINPEGEASRRLAAALQKDQELIASGKAEGMSPQDWTAAKNAGEPVTLADLGSSNTQALLRSSANTSPEGRAILEKVINDRFAGQTERVANDVRNLVAGGANAGKTGEDLVAAYDKARKPLYQQAYQQGDKEIVSPTIERLMGSPMFEAAMKNAITSGKDRAITEGYGAFNPGVAVENGMIKFTKAKPGGVPQYPNLQYWDAVKRELDGVASTAARAGDKGRAEVAGNMAKTLRGELDQQVPSYANARGVAAQYFGESNALEAGQKLAGKKVDPAQITQIMGKMKPDERDLFREGYASDWANRVISNVSDSRDITKAMFNSPNERARALAVFGPAGLSKMQTRMTLETIMDGARKAMGNSTTARQLIEAGLAGGGLEGYLSGWDPQKMAAGAAGAAGARKFLGSEMAAGARKLVGKVDSRTAKLVAELLTSSDPNKLAQGMRMAQKNQKIAAGLNNIANRVTLAGQSQGSAPLTRVYISRAGLGQGPVPGYASDENQNPPGPLH